MAKLNFFVGEYVTDRNLPTETREYRCFIEAFDDTHEPINIMEITMDGVVNINSLDMNDMRLEEMGLQTEIDESGRKRIKTVLQ